MNIHNLGTVLAFEVRRTLMKPSFWLTCLSGPLLIAVVVGLMWFSQSTATATVEAGRDEPVSFTYTDVSGIVSPAVAARLGGTPTTDAAGAAQAVREGRAQLHIDVPADPSREPTHVVGADLGLVASGQWEGVASDLLRLSAAERIADPRLTSVVSGVETSTELWKDGQRSPGWAAVIAPGFFLVLLYLAVLMLGQQMLNVTVEEKENRVTEMILTTIDPTVLIVGKLVAIVIVGIVQALVLIVPVSALTLIPGLGAATPSGLVIAGQPVVLEPLPLFVAAALFVGGFLLFTALLVAVGSVMPTAKDAGTAFGAVVLAMFLPLYAGALIIGAPRSPVTEVLTWFPLTAPATALVRNATGSLPPVQALGVILLLFATAGVLLWLGVRLFRQGSISYHGRLRVLQGLRGR